MSSLRIAILAAGLSILAACPSDPNSTVCPGTGILCPTGTYCGAVQPICLTTACGNGLVDPGEECDDGNVLAGDSCSPICRKEACGNNVLDPGEVCDDGNTVAGDGCSPNCMSKEVCGNGVVDVGEACDDGLTDIDPVTMLHSTHNADGCSGTPVMVTDGSGNTVTSPDPCKSTEVCGNGIKDVQTGEVCDDGNTLPGDHCSPDCRSGLGCGNGVVDPGEECDDGNVNNNDACLNTCKTAKCGDGVVDSAQGEQCDPSTTGTPLETVGCNIDCTTRTCGDGKVNQTAGEQCDNGVGNNGDNKNCTGTCVLNICGDGKVDMQAPGIEQCDDGNQNNTDGCSNACALASCGNSTIDQGEQCDDGNTDDTDACVACHTAICGDGKVRAGVEECDDGNLANGDGCSSSCRMEGCHNGNLDPGEQCDDGNSDNTDACVGNCKIAVCGDTFVRAGVEQCDDGNLINGDMCSSTCRSEGCGNGSLDPGEQCDDHNTVSGDGCSATCMFEACGDGIINNGEQCDGNGMGMGGETATCNVDCTTRSCGDGKVNSHAGEQCDAGTLLGVNQNADNRDCTAACHVNICTDGLRDTLGPLHFESCDDGNTIPTDGCSNNCTLASCNNGLLDPGEECDDNNMINTDECVDCMHAVCGDGFVEAGVEECDTFPAMGFQCSPANGTTPGCRLQRCGNGIIDPGEQCDNDVVPVGGTPLAGDGCNAVCVIEFCGDGVDNNNAHESCDPGLTENGVCNRNCTDASCGDGIVNHAHTASGLAGDGLFAGAGPEQCDPPNANGGCSGACRFEKCGDGILQTSEECDVVGGVPTDSGGALVTGHSCSQCHEVFCGNNEIEAANPAGGETCEPPNTTRCDSVCKIIPLCGDHVVNGSEDCEIGVAGKTNITCDGDCSNVSCGDGFTNAFAGEQCDPGNGASTDSPTCDSDCTPVVCGDGHINTALVSASPKETCDDGATQNKPCPYQAAGPNTCSKCNATCNAMATVTGPYCGDGAVTNTETCDQGALNGAACAYNDESCTRCMADCTGTFSPGGAFCGDNVINGPTGQESCDPPNVAATATTTGCNATCQVIPVTTSCGNGVINAGEQCDGANLAGLSCGSFMYSGGALACFPVTDPTPANRCKFDFAACTSPTPFCGDNIVNGSDQCEPPNTSVCDATCQIITPPAPTCSDSIRNGNEILTDCGGGTCTGCPVGTICNTNADCLSPSTCDTGVSNKCI